MRRSGYTLNELIIVVIIIGVIVSMALPRYSSLMERMRSAEGVETLTALLNAEKMYFIDNDRYTSNISELDVEIPASNIFSPPELSDNPAQLASVRRITGEYYLDINENGVISCTGDICSRLGY